MEATNFPSTLPAANVHKAKLLPTPSAVEAYFYQELPDIGNPDTLDLATPWRDRIDAVSNGELSIHGIRLYGYLTRAGLSIAFGSLAPLKPCATDEATADDTATELDELLITESDEAHSPASLTTRETVVSTQSAPNPFAQTSPLRPDLVFDEGSEIEAVATPRHRWVVETTGPKSESSRTQPLTIRERINLQNLPRQIGRNATSAAHISNQAVVDGYRTGPDQPLIRVKSALTVLDHIKNSKGSQNIITLDRRRTATFSAPDGSSCVLTMDITKKNRKGTKDVSRESYILDTGNRLLVVDRIYYAKLARIGAKLSRLFGIKRHETIKYDDRGLGDSAIATIRDFNNHIYNAKGIICPKPVRPHRQRAHQPGPRLRA